jgi:hypothetical protein
MVRAGEMQQGGDAEFKGIWFQNLVEQEVC